MRPPDLIIGPRGNPQTERWHLLKWRGWQIALHKWHRSDDDRALHDHVGHNVSILLNGCYREVLSHAWQPLGHPAHRRPQLRLPFVPYFRRADAPHRVELLGNRPIWSLWVRWPPVREWGFHCPKGWRHWSRYVAERDYSTPGSSSTIGAGCE